METTESQAGQASLHEVWASAQQMAGELTEFSNRLGRLLVLELRLAISNLPKVAGLAIVLLPIAILTWIGFTVLLSWGMYAWTGSPAAGIACFAVLNLALAILLGLQIRRLLNEASFPATRRQLDQLKEFAHDAPPTMSS